MTCVLCCVSLVACLPSAFDNVQARKRDAAMDAEAPSPRPDAGLAAPVTSDAGSHSIVFDAAIAVVDAAIQFDAGARERDAGQPPRVPILDGGVAIEAGIAIDGGVRSVVHVHAEGGVVSAHAADDRDAGAR